MWYPFAKPKTKGCETDRMAERKSCAGGKGLDRLAGIADTMSLMLAQEVRELNARQKEARREGGDTAGVLRGMKEVSAILKDMAAVKKSLSEPGMEEERACGVVLLPPVEDL